MTAPIPRDIVAEHFPYDGPYSDERTADAAEALGELVRYLANATQKDSAVTVPSTIARVLGELHTATFRMDQVLAQLGDLITAAGPDLRDDRPDRDPAETAADAFGAITEARVRHLPFADALDEAHQSASHLSRR